MRTIIWDMLKFLRKRDSNSAICLMIGIAEYMTQQGRINARDYMQALHDADQPRGIA